MMRMIEVKCTLKGGTRVTLTTMMSKPMITLRKSSGDQREPDDRFYCDLEEWAEIIVAVQELKLMVGGDDPPPEELPARSVRHG